MKKQNAICKKLKNNLSYLVIVKVIYLTSIEWIDLNYFKVRKK